MALASYERTLVPDRTPFDLGTLTPQEALGLQVFRVNGLCESCHPSTPGLFSDGFAHDIQLAAHTRSVKAPTLRNVGLRPRLMSGGQFTSLGEVLAHYERIGFLIPLTQANREALLVFLANGLTDERVLRRQPPFDRPTLRSERVPSGSNLYGRSWPGSGGFVPEMLADAPANLGNDDWRLGLGRALGGATAFLALSDERARPGATFRGVPVAVDLARATLQAFGLSGEGPGGGTRTVHLRVPNDASLIGRERFAQWLVLDPNALGGASVSRGARIELVSERLRRPSAREELGGATTR